MKCSIDDCDSEAIAKGMCVKHYARQRRTGSAETTRRPGAPKSSALEALRRQLGAHASERTIARIARAMTLLREAGVTDDDTRDLMQCAMRSNGAINAARFEEEAEWRAMSIEQREMIFALANRR